jgi:hypothetical protein
MSQLTTRQLRSQLRIRGRPEKGAKSDPIVRLKDVLSLNADKKRWTSKRRSNSKTEEISWEATRTDIDAFIDFAISESITLSQFRDLLSILKEDRVFGEGRLLALSALAHNVWTTLGLMSDETRFQFLDMLEDEKVFKDGENDAESNREKVPEYAGRAYSMMLSDIACHQDRKQLLRATAPPIAPDFGYIYMEMNKCCHPSSGVARPPALKLQEFGRRMGPLNNTNDPAVSAMLPSLIALRNAGVVDGTLGCGATPAERAEAYRLQALFERWEQRHPWIQTFLDPPFAIVIPSDAPAIPSLGNILASIPHRFVDAPVDPSDGTPTAGLVQGVGGVESAR